MRPFALKRPENLQEAVQEAEGRPGARYIAGGTNLIDLMKEDVERPEVLIDVEGLGLEGVIELPDGGLRLGATTTNASTAYHPLVREQYPLLSEAILSGASPQLRNMATNGGNLMQRTRCYYFYDTHTACNKRDPGSGCAALNGFNRIHAILGASEQCIATHPSDMCVALCALGATVLVDGSGGERRLPVVEFHRLPGDRPELDTVLEQGELIQAVELPAERFTNHFCYLKVRDRESYAFALVSVAAALKLQGKIIEEVRLALGGVAHKPWRAFKAEELLRGREASSSLFEKAAGTILEDARGYGHNDFKIPLVRRAVVKALTQALERTSL